MTLQYMPIPNSPPISFTATQNVRKCCRVREGIASQRGKEERGENMQEPDKDDSREWRE
jgi:hypothetical protein